MCRYSMSQFPNALTIIPMPVSDRIPSLPPRDLALNMANIPWELRQNTSWSPIRAYVTMFILHQEKSGMNIHIYISIHTRIYTVSYVHIFYTRIWFLYIFQEASRTCFPVFCEALNSLFLAMCLGANQLWIQFEQGNGSTSSNIQLLWLSGCWT